ncbi:MAG TPA: AAA family ATPase, partial [Alphaproteobacteria bacterium]|nr:AAA family ATPase [Alphaproteobacteria bacterium]
ERIHRFDTDSKRGKNSGWYILYTDGESGAGAFGDWRGDFKQEFQATTSKTLSFAERKKWEQRISESMQKADLAREKMRDSVADVAGIIWEKLNDASPEHPYLKKKGIEAHGLKITGDGSLAAPLYTSEGNLATIQYIKADGDKKFHTGGQAGGCWWCIGDPSKSNLVYVAEGIATAATVFEETNAPCFVAYSAQNMRATTEVAMSYSNDGAQIILIADNDESGTGAKKASEAAKELGLDWIMPPDEGTDMNDFRLNGGDVATLIKPKPKDAWLVSADDFCAQPAPVKWLIKDWLQDEALMMIHGPSGSGKTFVVLDMIASIAGGKQDWDGHKVTEGNVVYLAGEGHNGLKGRISAWKEKYQINSLKMWISKEGCDLNTANGEMKAITAIKSIGESPSIIVVDTLHRFLDGDENSPQDAKTMIDACGRLTREFGCSVILVHHTGLGTGSKNRARGSSSWRGALDIEINIEIDDKEDDAPRKLQQVKNKDSEESEDKFFMLRKQEIPNWFDEDGEQVNSAVPEYVKGGVSDKVQSSVNKLLATNNLKTVLKIWEHGGKQIEDDVRIFSRDDAIDYFTEVESMALATAKKYLKPSIESGPIYEAVKNGKLLRNADAFSIIGD